MLDSVLDQGLQEKRGDERCGNLRVNSHVNAQPLAEADLFDLQISADEAELFAHSNQVALRARQHITKHFSQPCGHHLRFPRFRANQVYNRIERVEEEMGIDLSPERLQLSFGQ